MPARIHHHIMHVRASLSSCRLCLVLAPTCLWLSTSCRCWFCFVFGCLCVCPRFCLAGRLVVFVGELPAPLSILWCSTSGSRVGRVATSCRRACMCPRDVGPPCLLAIVHERLPRGYLCGLSSIFCFRFYSVSPYCLPFQRCHYCHCSCSRVVAFSRCSHLISSKNGSPNGSLPLFHWSSLWRKRSADSAQKQLRRGMRFCKRHPNITANMHVASHQNSVNI